MTSAHRFAAACLCAGLLAAACGGKGGTASGSSAAASDTAGVSRSEVRPAVTAQLDSGNTAYRAKDYQEARKHYREAARMAPDFTAAWFGVYMAETALGDTAAADSARSHLGNMSQAAGAHNMPHAGMLPQAGMAHPGMPQGTTGSATHHDTT